MIKDGGLTDEEKGEASEALIAAQRARIGRECGDCSLCCKVLEVAQIGKPDNVWCSHAKPKGGGCAIYNSRPAICRGFACAWLMTGLSEDWYPLKSKIVVHTRKTEDGFVMWFEVDPSVPGRWREEPFYSYIKQRSLAGLLGVEGIEWRTGVKIGQRKILVLPNKEVEWGAAGVVLRVGEAEWQLIPCKDNGAAQELLGKLGQFQAMVQALPEDEKMQMRLELMERQRRRSEHGQTR